MIRYFSPRLAESVTYGGVVAGGLAAVFGLLDTVNEANLMAAVLFGMCALGANFLSRLIPLGWEDQSSLNHMGVSQWRSDKEVAARLDRQWFKWW